ncbi:MAG: lipocalin-like domain-containing protein [Leucothrix sp.]
MKQLLLSVLLGLIISSSTALGAEDSFRVLRQQLDGYAKVVPGKRFVFPDDHGVHPDYRIEWWYLTANLKDDQNREWGLQWTLFRQSMDAQPVLKGWSSNQLWMAHAAITTPGGHIHEQRFARGGIGQAGVTVPRRADLNEHRKGNFAVWIDDWSWQANSANPFPSTLKFSIGKTQLSVNLRSDKPWVLNGRQGYSQKSGQGQASYYYSQPHIQVKGRVIHEGKPVSLVGHAWLDREWSSQPLSSNQQGWDWFSLHLDEGEALMVYRLRQSDGQHWLSGSLIKANGQSQSLGPDDIRLTEQDWRWVKAGAESVKLPLRWVVALPKLNKQWDVAALYDQQWMDTQFPYWEGVVNVDGGKAGVGYMELTGYPIVPR